MHSDPHTESEPADDRRPPAQDDEESGSGEDGGSSLPLPFAPDKDDHSPFGDTDQHSDA